MISLAHIHKLTLREIADITEIPVETVHACTTEALRTLNRVLGGAEIEP